MKKDFISARPSGSEKNEPKVIGEVLNDYLRSNEPLAAAFRSWKAKSEAAKATEAVVETGQLFKNLFPNTEMDIDLKLITRQPGRLHVGDAINCMLTHDDDFHYTAVENAIERKAATEQRNPHVYLGKRINVNRRNDGTLYPTFNRPSYTKDFSFQDFCREAADELIIVAGLIENESVEEESE